MRQGGEPNYGKLKEIATAMGKKPFKISVLALIVSFIGLGVSIYALFN